MREVTLRDTKARLAHWARMAERGASLRLTRRGKPVAVLMSEREYERLKAAGAPRCDFLRFLQGWRREMIAKGPPLAAGAEIEAMRERPHAGLETRLRKHRAACAFPAPVIDKLQFGVSRLPASERRDMYQLWLRALLADFPVIPLDGLCARWRGR